MTTTIRSNGRHRTGASLDTLEELFERLAQHPLTRDFEAFGDFVITDPQNERGEPLAPAGTVWFWGNFFTYSHVFHVETDDPALIERLTSAIRANQTRDDYLDQPPYFDGGKLEIIEHRASETQGEVTLRYDGRSLGRFGDRYTIQGNGSWRGHGGNYWRDAARKLLADEHAASRRTLSRPAP